MTSVKPQFRQRLYRVVCHSFKFQNPIVFAFSFVSVLNSQSRILLPKLLFAQPATSLISPASDWSSYFSRSTSNNLALPHTQRRRHTLHIYPPNSGLSLDSIRCMLTALCTDRDDSVIAVGCNCQSVADESYIALIGLLECIASSVYASLYYWVNSVSRCTRHIAVAVSVSAAAAVAAGCSVMMWKNMIAMHKMLSVDRSCDSTRSPRRKTNRCQLNTQQAGHLPTTADDVYTAPLVVEPISADPLCVA